MDYAEEIGGMRDSPVVTISPAQVEERARLFIGFPSGARCETHHELKSPVTCVNCRQVRLRAEEMSDRRSGRFSEQEIQVRQKLRECPMCDTRGLAKIRFKTGEELAIRCPHDAGVLAERRAEAAAKFQKSNRSWRKPVAADEEGRERIRALIQERLAGNAR